MGSNIEFKCYNCITKLTAPVSLEGGDVICPHCGEENEVPTRWGKIYNLAAVPSVCAMGACIVYACFTDNTTPLIILGALFLIWMTVVGPVLKFRPTIRSRGLWCFLVPIWAIGYVGIPVILLVPWPYGAAVAFLILVASGIVMWRGMGKG